MTMTKEQPVTKNVGTESPNNIETTRDEQFFSPRVDIFETDEELVLYADVPGVAPQDVDLRFEKGELILQGRINRSQRKGKPLDLEYAEGNFYRVFRVHESINSAKIEAECSNGVLTVHLPKEERVKPRKVLVKGS